MVLMMIFYDDEYAYDVNVSDHHQGEVLMGHYGTLQKNQLGQNVSAIASIIQTLSNSNSKQYKPELQNRTLFRLFFIFLPLTNSDERIFATTNDKIEALFKTYFTNVTTLLTRTLATTTQPSAAVVSTLIPLQGFVFHID